MYNLLVQKYTFMKDIGTNVTGYVSTTLHVPISIYIVTVVQKFFVSMHIPVIIVYEV